LTGPAPVLRVEFTLADGTLLEHEWTLEDTMFFAGGLPAWLRSPPEWLEGAHRVWDRPQDPLVFRGRVLAGHERDAQRLVEGDAGV